VLGFGCGSVLGRVGRAASLRAMNVAWDAGITLFDTARSYGYGEAEAVLGEFLRGKREQAVVATKYGISPQRPGTLQRAAIPLARAALRLPGVRGLVPRGGSREVTGGQFTVAGLRESIESSLRQLRTDRVDILYLHEAGADVMRGQDLMAELDALVRSGKVLRAGLYCDAGVVAEAMAGGPATLTAMQFGANCFDPVVAQFGERNERDLMLIGNHPFGGERRLARMKAILASIVGDEEVPAELREKLRDNDWQSMLEAILGVALNGTGIHALVFSMMREDHLRANVRAVESGRFAGTELKLLRERLLLPPVAVPTVTGPRADPQAEGPAL